MKETRPHKIQWIKTQKQKGTTTDIIHLSLPGLFSADQILVLHKNTRTLSLLSDGPRLIMEQQFSDNEMRVLQPILESYPHYCPYEVLLAHITSNSFTAASLERARQHLEQARNNGTRQQELRSIRRTLSPLRSKLHSFGLDVSNVRERGCSLTSFHSQETFNNQRKSG